MAVLCKEIYARWQGYTSAAVVLGPPTAIGQWGIARQQMPKPAHEALRTTSGWIIGDRFGKGGRQAARQTSTVWGTERATLLSYGSAGALRTYVLKRGKLVYDSLGGLSIPTFVGQHL
jgi:hypothetical protein